MRFWQRASQQPWAMSSMALTTILEIAARDNLSPDKVAANLGRELHHDYCTVEAGGVLEIPVTGPLFRYANVFTRISGATSYARIMDDLRQAFHDDAIKAIVLTLDSPGGEVNGCSELAQMIYQYRGKKPIVAYAAGDCCSGAYWIASACDRIVCADTSSLGSIGVVAVLDKPGKKGESSMAFVSSQSPYKRLDIQQDEGQQRVQQKVDALADVFVSHVATFRGVGRETVLQQYGQGDVLIGQRAVDAGLADAVGTLARVRESLMLEDTSTQGDVDLLQGSVPNGLAERAMMDKPSTDIHAAALPLASIENTSSVTLPPSFEVNPTATHIPSTQGDSIMDLEQLKQTYPALCQALIADSAEAEKTRLKTILSCDEAKGKQALARSLALHTAMSVEQMKETLMIMPVCDGSALSASESGATGNSASSAPPAASPPTDFAQMMATLPNPVIHPAEENALDGDADIQLAKRIAGVAF